MLKTYSFHSKYDHIFYFNFLIQEVLNYKDQFNICMKDLHLLESSLEEGAHIPILEFEVISRRKDGILRFLCNLLGDETKGAISFKKYRKKLKKDAPKYAITIPELPNAISAQLNELNQLRNWSLHYPESLLVAERALLKNTIRSDLIFRTNYKFYERKYLTKMIEELTDLSNYLEDIFNQMVNDYELLIGQKVSIIKSPITIKKYYLMQSVQDSWDMQNS